jgi:hypothetical protein
MKNTFSWFWTMKHYIIMSCIEGLHDWRDEFWIGWLHLLTPPIQSLWITVSYNNSQSVFSQTLLPPLPRTCPILIHLLALLIRSCTTCIVCMRTHRNHIHCIYSVLHSNGSYSIVDWIFVDAGMCLPSRYLEMGLHVTLLHLKATCPK